MTIREKKLWDLWSKRSLQNKELSPFFFTTTAFFKKGIAYDREVVDRWSRNFVHGYNIK